jgi:hypothetical protein
VEENVGWHEPETIPRIIVPRILSNMYHHVFTMTFRSQTGKVLAENAAHMN